MDIATHAQSMAHHCTPPFAELLLQVPSRLTDSRDLQSHLIREIVHASGMSQIDARQETTEMYYATASRLLTSATVQGFSAQQEATTQIVRMIAHAHGMAFTVPRAAERILSLVRPLTTGPLPTGPIELKALEARLAGVQSEIRTAAWS